MEIDVSEANFVRRAVSSFFPTTAGVNQAAPSAASGLVFTFVLIFWVLLGCGNPDFTTGKLPGC